MQSRVNYVRFMPAIGIVQNVRMWGQNAVKNSAAVSQKRQTVKVVDNFL